MPPPTNGRVPANYEAAAISSACRKIRGAPPYFYQSDGNSYVLKSFGPDGVESADDIDGNQYRNMR